MIRPYRMAFGPDSDVYLSGGLSQIQRFGTESEAVFTVSISIPSTVPLTVNFATADGSATAGVDYTAASGTLSFAPGITSKTICVATLDDTIAEPTETFSVNLSGAVDATIARGQGVATILDDDATKFYVVNDASSGSRTYDYGAFGSFVGNSGLSSGDTAPRGDASTAAGTSVWVVDANKHVYVYNTSGGLLGSWTAGSLSSHARVEGIATNGTDVWIVDAYQGKVFKYTNAAGRLSGSQNASSSFSLNSSDTNPMDIVTDGVDFWVVDAATSDKVFKYTLSGSLLGSWTLGAGTSPTGITLDPTNVSTLWVVDSGTDRVYQYDNAAGLTSGSQSPSTSFALAAGNTNPQGLADPPSRNPLTVATPRRRNSVALGFDHRVQGVVAETRTPGVRELPVSPSAPSRFAEKSFQATDLLTLSALKPNQDQTSFADGLTPAGPLALRSRLTAFRRRS